MSIAAIKASGVFYEIFAKDKTQGGLSSAEQRLQKFGARIGTIGAAMAGFSAAALGSLTMMIKGFAGAGDEISDAMNVTGLSSDFLQTLQFGAADAGVNFNALVGSLTKFNNVLAKTAANGGKIVGLDAKQLLAMKPDERIKAVVDAIDGIPDPALRAKAAMDAFGKAGAKLLPAFAGGAKALNEAMADMKDRGLIMSDEDRQLAASAEGAFLSLSLVLSRISQLVAAAVTPAFLQVMSVLQSAAEAVATFIDNNRTLVMWITGGIAVIGALGLVLMALGGAAIALSLATTGLTAALTALGAVAAFLASPVFLITAAIVGCGIAALVAAYYLDQLFNGGAALKFLQDMAMGAWQAMKLLWTAVSAGRWDLAGQLIANGLSLGFRSGILALKEMWNSFTDWLLDSITNAMRFLIDKVNAAAQAVGLSGIDTSFLDSAKAMARSGLNLDTTGDQKAVAEGAGALAETMAEIVKAGADVKAKRAGDAAGIPFDDGGFAARMAAVQSSAAGTPTSAGAANIGRTAGANSIQEQMLGAALHGNELLEDIKDGIEDMEGLVVE